MRTIVVVVVATLLAILWLFGIPVASRWLTIDRCLDAGGRWNDTTAACEAAEDR
jgi:hypothetical protein